MRQIKPSCTLGFSHLLLLLTPDSAISGRTDLRVMGDLAMRYHLSKGRELLFTLSQGGTVISKSFTWQAIWFSKSQP